MKFISKLRGKFTSILIILIVLAINLNSCIDLQSKTHNTKNLAINSSEKILPSPELSPVAEPPAPTILPVEPQYGHFPYREDDVKKMMIVASYAQDENQRFERLAPEAAQALMKLIYTARDDGVWIVPVSGFRTLDAQHKLFENQTKRRGSPEAAAKLSAPPGYSEHHTGYAIDLTDGHFPQQDITYQFAETEAFKWLKTHAEEFGFELSFPENNSQGISYEPWHWRFVGSLKAQDIFRIAKTSLNKNTASPPSQ